MTSNISEDKFRAVLKLHKDYISLPNSIGDKGICEPVGFFVKRRVGPLFTFVRADHSDSPSIAGDISHESRNPGIAAFEKGS
jgi:hypothetical protein